MQIIKRHAWGAKHPDGFADAPLPAKEVYLHHSAGTAPNLDPPFDDDDAAVRALENIGQQRFGGGISYSVVVTPVGRVYEGHSINRRGAHTKGRNSVARAICLVGNYDLRHPTSQQLNAVAQLLVHGYHAKWWVAPKLAGGHRDAPGAATACPGKHAHAAIPAINELAQRQGADVALNQQDIDRIADAVLTRLFPNAFGDRVTLVQVVNGIERRCADVQLGIDELSDELLKTDPR